MNSSPPKRAASSVVRIQLSRRPLREELKCPVTIEVPEAIVVALELVDVEEGDAE